MRLLASTGSLRSCLQSLMACSGLKKVACVLKNDSRYVPWKTVSCLARAGHGRHLLQAMAGTCQGTPPAIFTALLGRFVYIVLLVIKCICVGFTDEQYQYVDSPCCNVSILITKRNTGLALTDTRSLGYLASNRAKEG